MSQQPSVVDLADAAARLVISLILKGVIPLNIKR